MSDQLKLVKVDLTRITRLKLFVPADVDDDLVARAVEYYYDGSTMYGGGEEDGEVVLRSDNPISNDAQVADSEPAEDVDANTTRAVQDYWRWVAQQAEVTA